MEKIKFTKETQVMFYNLKAVPIQQMLDYDYLCERRTPSISAIIHPGRKSFHKAFFGKKEILIPLYNSIQEAVKKHNQVEILINFSSFRSAYESSKEALQTNSIKSIFIVAEGIPERQTRELIALAKEKNILIVGPSSVGGIIAGKLRIGYAGGKNENIIKSRLYQPGSVGLVSKSGGMMNELFNIISQTTNGINEGIAIGGDSYPGSTLLEHIFRYENNPEIKLIVALSELGGKDEYEIIKAKQEKKIIKPLIMWVTGTCASIFPYEVQFGHAGARSGKKEENAEFKNKSLKEAGIIVPESFAELQNTIKEQFQLLKKQGKINMKNNNQQQTEKQEIRIIPKEYNEAIKEGLVRKKTNITSTISSDLGDEPTYNKVKISEIINNNYSVGKIIGLLWFKRDLPKHFTKFLDQCILIIADHGPAVSGAHNSIIASRAGKDIISSLCSGLLTIGPRFGGAIDAACRYFKESYDKNQSATEFVNEMKIKGIKIPGIGHRIKSSKNPDKRVELLKRFAKENFQKIKYLDYALEIEKITLQKSDNLILNVDGCIAALFLDTLNSSEFNEEEIKQILKIGYMNGLFALSRSIGLIGHILDQKRLNEPLYRHQTDDILYG